MRVCSCHSLFNISKGSLVTVESAALAGIWPLFPLTHLFLLILLQSHWPPFSPRTPTHLCLRTFAQAIVTLHSGLC